MDSRTGASSAICDSPAALIAPAVYRKLDARPNPPAMLAETSDRSALESLLSFWSEAGVEACYEDEPQDRVVRAPPPARPASVSPIRPAAVEPQASPDIAAAMAQARE